MFANTTSTCDKEGHVGQSKQAGGLHTEDADAALLEAHGRHPLSDDDRAKPDVDGRAASEVDAEAAEAEPLLPAQEDTCMQSDKSRHATTGEGRGSASCGPATGRNRKEHDAGAGPSEGGPEGEQDYWRRLWKLARRGDVLAFFTTVTAMGYGYGVVSSFL